MENGQNLINAIYSVILVLTEAHILEKHQYVLIVKNALLNCNYGVFTRGSA